MEKACVVPLQRGMASDSGLKLVHQSQVTAGGLVAAPSVAE